MLKFGTAEESTLSPVAQKLLGIAIVIVADAATAVLSQTAKHIEFHDSPEVKTPPGFSHAAVVSGGRLVFVSGQVGRDKQGKMPSDFRGQTAGAFANLKLVLAAAGAKPEDVIKLNYYVVGLNHEKLVTLREQRDQFLAGAHPPASTLAGVQALAQEDIQVEIEAVAALP
jgi:enamine deaminase RidA (YjgF/YER057c/UK114 family)